MRRLFLLYGPIHSITIPTSKAQEEGGRPQAKGFAFVWMMSKKDAEKAIEGANGVTVGGEKDGNTNGKGKERVIAVDWALSKERWEVEKENIQEDDDVGEGSDVGSDGGSQEDESEDENVGVHEDSESDGEGAELSDDEDVHDADDVPDRPQLPPPETGNTLFVRNVPFTATEDELRTLYVLFYGYYVMLPSCISVDFVRSVLFGMPVLQWTLQQGDLEAQASYVSGTRRMQTGRSSKLNFCWQRRVVHRYVILRSQIVSLCCLNRLNKS